MATTMVCKPKEMAVYQKGYNEKIVISKEQIMMNHGIFRGTLPKDNPQLSGNHIFCVEKLWFPSAVFFDDM